MDRTQVMVALLGVIGTVAVAAIGVVPQVLKHTGDAGASPPAAKESAGGTAPSAPAGSAPGAVRPTTASAAGQAAPAPAEAVLRCAVAGKVVARDGGGPVAGVHIAFLHDEPSGPPRTVRPAAATTAADGSFRLDCAGIARSDFPLHLQVRNPTVRKAWLSRFSVAPGDRRSGLVIPVGAGVAGH